MKSVANLHLLKQENFEKKVREPVNLRRDNAFHAGYRLVFKVRISYFNNRR
jgi:hypothetical protein